MSTSQADTPATGREDDRRLAVERYQEGSSLREISIGLGRSTATPDACSSRPAPCCAPAAAPTAGAPRPPVPSNGGNRVSSTSITRGITRPGR